VRDRRLSWPRLLSVDLLLVCLLSGDNILTAVSVARQCDLVPAYDQLVFVNAYSPDEETSAARIEWLRQDDYTRPVDPASSSLTPSQVIVPYCYIHYC